MDVFKSNCIELVLVPALATTRLVGKNDIDVSYENNSCSGQNPLTVMTGVELIS